MTLEDAFLRHVVVRAIGYASHERSLFLHGCPSFKPACEWHTKAMRSERNTFGCMVRINVAKVGGRHAIDLSNLESQKVFVNKAPKDTLPLSGTTGNSLGVL